jgi:large subunit ribosomal protein L17
MLTNLVCSLIEHEQIKTTLPKAKDLRPLVERMITQGKKGSLHARRLALARLLGSQPLVQKLMGPLAERFKDRSGGYTRIVKTGNRYGDNAPMAVIEFVDFDLAAKIEMKAAQAVAREAAEEGAEVSPAVKSKEKPAPKNKAKPEKKSAKKP